MSPKPAVVNVITEKYKASNQRNPQQNDKILFQ